MCQPEVSDVVGAVDGLAQGTQHHRLNQMAVGTPLHLGDQLGVVARLGLVAAAQTQTEFLRKLRRSASFSRVGPSCTRYKRRDLVLEQEARRGDVGGDHAFLDQAMGIVAHHRHDALDLAIGPEHDTGFGAFEVDGAARLAGAAHHLVERMQLLQLRQHARGRCACAHAPALENGRHFVVGEACRRAHDAFEETRARTPPAGADVHLAHHAQAVDLRVERAQAVGEHLRQHGNDPLREIYRVAARLRLDIERAGAVHVGRHVGNRHEEAPALGLALAVHGIVEIARICTVDGHQRQCAQIRASDRGLRRHFRGQVGDFLLHGVGPVPRQIVRADSDVDLHARGHVRAEHLDHLTDRLGIGLRLLDDAHHYDLAVLGRALVLGGDHDLVTDALVIGDDEANAALEIEAPDQLLGAALQHLHDLPFAPPAAVEADDPHQHAIAMEQRAHLTRREIHILAAFVGNQKTESVRMTGYAPGHQIHLLRRTVALAPVAHQLAVADHGIEPAPQRLAVAFLLQRELGDERLVRERGAALGEILQNELAAGDGMFVAARFAFREGIVQLRAFASDGASHR